MARGATHAGADTYKVFIAPIGRLARTSVINPNNLLSYPFLPRHESGRADNEFIDDYGSGTTRFACKYAYVTKLAASRLVVFEPSLFRSSYSPLTFSSSFFAVHVARTYVYDSFRSRDLELDWTREP